MPSLLNIGEDMQALAALLQEAADTDGELSPEVSAQLDAWFAGLEADLERKAGGYAALIREQELLAAARKEEAERLTKGAAAASNLARRLKDRLLDFMQGHGIKKIDGVRPIRVQANGGKQPLEVLVFPRELPPGLQRITVEADTEAIRELLACGKGESWGRLLPRGFHLRIGS